MQKKPSNIYNVEQQMNGVIDTLSKEKQYFSHVMEEQRKIFDHLDMELSGLKINMENYNSSLKQLNAKFAITQGYSTSLENTMGEFLQTQ